MDFGRDSTIGKLMEGQERIEEELDELRGTNLALYRLVKDVNSRLARVEEIREQAKKYGKAAAAVVAAIGAWAVTYLEGHGMVLAAKVLKLIMGG